MCVCVCVSESVCVCMTERERDRGEIHLSSHLQHLEMLRAGSSGF